MAPGGYSFSKLFTRDFAKPVTATMVALMFALLGCSFGGSSGNNNGGGGSGVTVLNVNTVTPTNNATGVDVRDVRINVFFSAPINPIHFTNASANVSALLQKYGFAVYQISNNTTVSNATLGELVTGKYYVGRQIGGQPQFILPEWKFIDEGNGLTALEFKLPSTGETFYYSGAEMRDSGLLNTQNTSFSLTDSSGNVIPGMMTFQNERTISFQALKMLNWNTAYTVRVKAGVTELNGSRRLQNDFVSTFKTAEVTEPAVDSATPVGINASPLGAISFSTNFTVDSASIAGKVILEKLTLDDAGIETGATPVDVTLTVNSQGSTVTVQPAQELDYLTKYRVTVRGGYDGIGCVFTNNLLAAGAGGCMNQSYAWEFTTAKPRVERMIPEVLNPDIASFPIGAEPEIEFNFRPDINSARSRITLTKNDGATQVAFTASLVGNNRVAIVPVETNGTYFDYGTKYSINIAAGVASSDRPGVATVDPVAFTFTTENRRIISRDPEADTKSFDPDSGIIRVTFNFVPKTSQIQDRAFFAVNKREPGDGAWVGLQHGVDATITNNNGVVTINPTNSFDYNTRFQIIVSQNLQEECIGGVGCATIFEGSTWEFEAINLALTIASSTPLNNATNVPLNSSLELKFNYNLDQSSVNANSVSITSTCSVPSLTVTWNENSILVRPNGNWKSFCRYTATVSNDVRGERSQTITSPQTVNFNTDGLRVTGVFVTYAYGSYVDIESEIIVRFNYDLGCCATGNWIQVYDDFNRQVLGSVFRSGRELRFVPTSVPTGGSTSVLKYGMGYDVIINKANVIGVNGEELQNNYATSFLTENLPVFIEDYGPTGYDVFIDDDFWVEVTTPYNGFQNRTQDPAFPFVYGDILEDGFWDIDIDIELLGNEIFLEPDFLLDYDTDYTIELEFSYDYGGFYDDFTFDWDITTELPPVSEAATMSVASTKGTSSVLSVNLGQRTNRASGKPRVRAHRQHKPAAQREQKSCGSLQITGCESEIADQRKIVGKNRGIEKMERVALETQEFDYDPYSYITGMRPARTLKDNAVAEQNQLRAERREARLKDRQELRSKGGKRRTSARR